MSLHLPSSRALFNVLTLSSMLVLSGCGQAENQGFFYKAVQKGRQKLEVPIPYLKKPAPRAPTPSASPTPAPETPSADASPTPAPDATTDTTDTTGNAPADTTILAGAPTPATPPDATTPEVVTPDEPMPPQGHEIQVAPDALDAVLAGAKVQCEKTDAASCPESVAMLIVRMGEQSFGSCTGFLVGDRYMMTNSHCVPDAIKSAGASCDGVIDAFFPASDATPAEHVRCKQVITASEIAGEGQSGFVLKPDYALIELSHALTRKPLEISREGIADAQALRAITVDPQSKTEMIGLLKVKECSARQNSMAAPSFTQDLAPVAAFSPCNIIPGNSGSPAVDADGRVRGIVHATLPGQKNAVTGEIVFQPLGLATNIACTDIPAAAGPLAASAHPDCAKTVSEQDVVVNAFAKADRQLFSPLIQEWKDSSPKALRFEMKAQPVPEGTPQAAAWVSPQILCIRDPKEWFTTGGPANNPAASHAHVSFVAPFWGFTASLDQYYRVELKAQVLDQVQVALDFDTDELAKGSTTVTTVTTKSLKTGETSEDKGISFDKCLVEEPATQGPPH